MIIDTNKSKAEAEGNKGTEKPKDTTAIIEETKTTTKETENTIHISKCELSIRRKNSVTGLPGDDPLMQNPKIGSSFKGRGPLSGLDIEEERIYLPEVIGVAPQDNAWRKEVREYWNNISERVPHDKEGTDSRFPGRPINFKVIFKDKKDKKIFDETKSFEIKANISKRGEVPPEDVADYILFRYCLVYSRVANSVEDIYKSAKISFYLYSKENEDKKKYNLFELRNRARTLFTSILEEESKINAILRVFGKNPDDAFLYASLEDKHLALDKEIHNNPNSFIQYANDKSLLEKALIKEATGLGILHNPPNTETYYFGDDRQVSLGTSLEDAVLFLKSKTEKNQQVLESIKAQLLSYKK